MITLSILLISFISLILRSNAQCGDVDPSIAQATNTGDGMTISLTLCEDDFIYIQIDYTQFNDKWFGIRLPNPTFTTTGSKMAGPALVYTDEDTEGLHSYTVPISTQAITPGVSKDAPQLWTEVNTTKVNGITTIYRINVTDAAALYGDWDLTNQADVPIYYVLKQGAPGLTISSGHGGSATLLTLTFPTPTTTGATTTAQGTTGTVDTTISVDDILALSETLWAKFKEGGTFSPLAATTVRLAFHDCGGYPEEYEGVNGTQSICNGCIDFARANHKGLNDVNGQVVDQLEAIFLNQGPDGVNDVSKWTHKMSLADFWMAAATIAIQHTHDNSGKDTLPTIPFYFGREECSTSPAVNTTISPSKDFPDGTDPWDDVETWFDANFNFTPEEIVALLGAHTIGMKHSGTSGMTDPWVTEWGKFDNQFYIDLINKDWDQQSNGQWDSGSFSMMNVDIGLFKFIEDELNTTNNAVGCAFDDCPSNNETASFVQAFADDNSLWLQTFVQAWIKMITVGYQIDALTEIIINVDETTTEFPEPGTTLTTEKDDDDDEFEIVQWLTDNWYFVVGGVVGLILLIVLCVCCCKMSKKRKEKRSRDIEMFGTQPV